MGDRSSGLPSYARAYGAGHASAGTGSISVLSFGGVGGVAPCSVRLESVGLHYMYERLAKKVAAMPEPARVPFFLELMEKVFPGAHNNVEGGTSFSWTQQPYQRGAYAVYSKGIYEKLGGEVPRPEGRVHFAGEHASPWPGWIQGALYSGLRAAREATVESQA